MMSPKREPPEVEPDAMELMATGWPAVFTWAT